MKRHVVRCLIAGVVAILPIGGTILGIVYAESMLAGTWLADQVWYFPGLGLIGAVLALYLLGLTVTTFLGRWLWRWIDRGLHQFPVLGELYATLKQILGYGGGKEALFHSVAMVPSLDTGGKQIGLVTQREEGGQCTVFLPGSPNPTAGRLVMLPEGDITKLDSEVSDALKVLVSLGKGSLQGD
ncbi:MAG: DUF502 domain-containing protein [Planctomycetota bacterium]|jgi:uncharacterized membrane protein